MTKPVVPREEARRDVASAVDLYLAEAGERVALRFIDEIERTYSLIGRHPGAGSLRYAFELAIPELRCVPIRRFPFLVFYRDTERAVDVWRVLHAKRDIPAWLRDADVTTGPASPGS